MQEKSKLTHEKHLKVTVSEAMMRYKAEIIAETVDITAKDFHLEGWDFMLSWDVYNLIHSFVCIPNLTS